MSADEVSFVDTNVLIYAYDSSAGQRHKIARDLLAELWRSRTGVTSTQVLQEFYVNVTRKIAKPLDRPTAREALDTYQAWPVRSITGPEVVAAAALEEREQLSFRDSLIIVSAAGSGATRLLTENLQAGRSINGVWVHNPFVH